MKNKIFDAVFIGGGFSTRNLIKNLKKNNFRILVINSINSKIHKNGIIHNEGNAYINQVHAYVVPWNQEQGFQMFVSVDILNLSFDNHIVQLRIYVIFENDYNVAIQPIVTIYFWLHYVFLTCTILHIHQIVSNHLCSNEIV